MYRPKNTTKILYPLLLFVLCGILSNEIVRISKKIVKKDIDFEYILYYNR